MSDDKLKDEFDGVLWNTLEDLTDHDVVKALREAFETARYEYKGSVDDQFTDEQQSLHNYKVTLTLDLTLWGDQEKRILEEYLASRNTS